MRPARVLKTDILWGVRQCVRHAYAPRHASGVHSHVEASKRNRLAVGDRAYGEFGSYVLVGPDVQAQAIFAGQGPVDDLAGWGYESKEYWGRCARLLTQQRVPSEQGVVYSKVVEIGGRRNLRV